MNFKTFFDEDCFIALEMFMDRMKEDYQATPKIVYERSLAAIYYDPTNDSDEVLTNIIGFADAQELAVVLKGEPIDSIKEHGFILNNTDRDFRFGPNEWVRKYLV